MKTKSLLLRSCTLSLLALIALLGGWALLSAPDAAAQTYNGVYCDVVGPSSCYSCAGNPSPPTVNGTRTGCQFPTPSAPVAGGVCMQGTRTQSCTPGYFSCGKQYVCGNPPVLNGKIKCGTLMTCQ